MTSVNEDLIATAPFGIIRDRDPGANLKQLILGSRALIRLFPRRDKGRPAGAKAETVANSARKHIEIKNFILRKNRLGFLSS